MAVSSEEARRKAIVGWVAGSVLVVGAGVALILISLRLATETVAEPSETPSPAFSGGEATQWAAVLATPLDGGAAAGDLRWLKTGMTDDGRPWIGAEHPELELDEFVDFQCPRCCEACPFLQRLFARFPDKVRIYIRHLPRSAEGAPAAADGSSRSCQLARAAICAGRQGRYWEAHDYLFHHRAEMATKHTCVSALCRNLGLDEEAFRRCVDEPSVQRVLARDVGEARALGIRETPTFVAGGNPYRGGIPDEVVDALEKGSANSIR